MMAEERKSRCRRTTDRNLKKKLKSTATGNMYCCKTYVAYTVCTSYQVWFIHSKPDFHQSDIRTINMRAYGTVRNSTRGGKRQQNASLCQRLSLRHSLDQSLTILSFLGIVTKLLNVRCQVLMYQSSSHLSICPYVGWTVKGLKCS